MKQYKYYLKRKQISEKLKRIELLKQGLEELKGDIKGGRDVTTLSFTTNCLSESKFLRKELNKLEIPFSTQYGEKQNEVIFSFGYWGL